MSEILFEVREDEADVNGPQPVKALRVPGYAVDRQNGSLTGTVNVKRLLKKGC
ncbi:MAG: hypothetical protein PHD76_02160 [Methylacidiphilales bacterium]|nr:hypothetical protein [Candidatus Methylacidiphilales bacterium]